MRSEVRALRCAIYTRVSTEHGLEQAFNSLENQREAAEAYIKSQGHEGWRLLSARYDDGGFSGGTLTRPALQQLLSDIQGGQVDVVVVYKVDRLTRALSDFAKLVELFDAHQVSFVSVTQAFNTTTSMGRLTLNVLLSFAQFEREVTGERIRDKIAASKKMGLWMGGVVPLGYRVESRSLHMVEAHACVIRLIYRLYLELGSVTALKRHLDEHAITVPERQDGEGRVSGGGRFSRGHLYKLLANPLYIGQIGHRGRTYEGQHPAIIDHRTWQAVQDRLSSQVRARTRQRQSSESVLMGRLFDDRGNAMTPSYAQKGQRRYRYYVSQALLQGRAEEAGSVGRVPAPEIEQIVTQALKADLRAEDEASTTPDAGAPAPDQQSPTELIQRVVIGKDAVEVTIREGDGTRTIRLPWRAPSAQRRREIIVPEAVASGLRPIKVETRAKLLQAIARGRAWLDEILSGEGITTDIIAEREGCSERSVRMMLSLTSLAPDIVQACIEGRLPRGIGLTRLTELPLSWTEQRLALGIAARP
jgi:site-specific DNA recombinase